MPRYLSPAAGTLAILLIVFTFTACSTPPPPGDATIPQPTTAAQPVAALVGSGDTSIILLPTELPTGTATPIPPATVLPSRTHAPPDSHTPIHSTLTLTPTPTLSLTLNGIPISQIVVISDAVRQNIRKIFTKGQAQGRNPRAFSKVGDSTMAYPPFLATFEQSYRLGSYASLQPTIDRFPGSFARESIAVRKSMHTWSEFDPTWAVSGACKAGEGPLPCELRLNNPSIAIIRLGANDVSTPALFDQQLRRIVNLCLSNGIIPALGTKPDRLEGSANTINKLIAQAASSFQIPLWDYDRVAGTVPGKGLISDKVHFRGGGSHDYATKAAFASGDSLEDLTGLMMLDEISREISSSTAH